MSTVITKASEAHILVEQYCEEEQMLHNVFITPGQLWAMCKIAWPDHVERWTHREPGLLVLPLAFEKNPQGAHEGPEGVDRVSIEAQEAGASPVGRQAA